MKLDVKAGELYRVKVQGTIFSQHSSQGSSYTLRKNDLVLVTHVESAERRYGSRVHTCIFMLHASCLRPLLDVHFNRYLELVS